MHYNAHAQKKVANNLTAEANIELFQTALDQKNYTEAIQQFEFAQQTDSLIAAPFLIKYLTIFAITGDYQKAYTLLQPYILLDKLPSYLKEKATALYSVCSFAVRNPRHPEINVVNAGDSINTSAAEYFPSLDFQDSLFIFMRREKWMREDFYTSTFGENGFSEAVFLNDTLNYPNKKGSASFSKDMQTLYFAADYSGQGYGRYDIYKANKTTTGWSAPKNLGRNINTDAWDSAPSIAPDGKALYFCSNRPEGYGGIDIYVSYKNERGGWDEAENMGPHINTAGDEQTPFIHADNKSLYFSSTGWPGYGNADLFVSRKDKNGAWSKPVNLGYPINTYDNEGSVAVAKDGVEGFIASDRADSRGGLDIYKVYLAKNTSANWIDSTISTIAANTIRITPNQPQTFSNVFFEVNAAKLTSTFNSELDTLAAYLSNNHSATILLEGHTDNTGNETRNILLSQNRALAIQQYLIQKGIAPNRITTAGLGSSKPIANNTTPEGRAANRRTTFTIVLK